MRPRGSTGAADGMRGWLLPFQPTESGGDCARHWARQDLADDSRFATSQGRRDHHDEIDSHIGRWAKLHTARQAAELLQGAGVTAGPVLNTKEVLNEPHLKARRTVAYVDHPEVGRKRLVAIPWRIGGLAPIRYRHAPDVGQDNDFVFQEVLGLTEPEMSHREKTGALS